MKITLPPEIERALTTRASQLGTSPEVLAVESLRERFVADAEEEATDGQDRTLADFLEGYIGVLDSGEIVPDGARMSENTSKKFAEGLEKKRQAGRL
jgi:hypothetical protein